MKIAFTGGGSGGHFYPIIAVAEAVLALVKEERLLGAELYYFSDSPFNERALFEHNIAFRKIYAGKMRRYFSLLNITDLIKTFLGIIKALVAIFRLYPDVVMSKGGYASFPVVFAARLLGIPIVIHESDSVPGRVNLYAARFAKRIAISFPSAAEYFPKDKVALTGNPIRSEILNIEREGAFEHFSLEKGLPVVLVLGGSQGAVILNDILLDALPELLTTHQVIHQAGTKNIKIAKDTAEIVLPANQTRSRYKPFGYLNDLELRMAAGAADVVVSRAGSTIFEIAAWGLPSIIVPITDSNGDHQRKNAFTYAASGACSVIEEVNLSPHILISEIKRITGDENLKKILGEKAKAFARLDAARKIAREIIDIAIEHEPN